VCSALSEMGCDIVTGGGPGLMQAANEGARTAQASRIDDRDHVVLPERPKYLLHGYAQRFY
jgi:hypothetical protein